MSYDADEGGVHFVRTSLSFMGICFLLFFCSCQKKPRRIVFQPSDYGEEKTMIEEQPLSESAITDDASLCDSCDDVFSLIEEREAKFSDVPILPNACPFVDYFKSAGRTSDGSILAYSCAMKRQDILSFYEHQMKGLGWHLQGKVEGEESIQLFQKPDRVCIVSTRNYGACCQQLVITLVYKVQKELQPNQSEL